MTRGSIPYSWLEYVGVVEFIKFINGGDRLAKPEICLNEVYEIMLDCWQVDPNRRPSFDRIVRRIETAIREKETGGNRYVSPNLKYVNYPVEKYYAREGNLGSEEANVDPEVPLRGPSESLEVI